MWYVPARDGRVLVDISGNALIILLPQRHCGDGTGIWDVVYGYQPTNNIPRMVQGPCLSVPRPDGHPIHDINSSQQISGMRADDTQLTAGHITVFVRLIGPPMALSSRSRNPTTPDPPGPISTCKVDRTYNSMRVCSSHSHIRPATSPDENSNQPHHSNSSSSSCSQPFPRSSPSGKPGRAPEKKKAKQQQPPTASHQPLTPPPSLSP